MTQHEDDAERLARRISISMGLGECSQAELAELLRAQQAEPPAGCAEMAALLMELREYIEEECGLLTTVGISTDYEYQLLKRIDAALGKGDADGGREDSSE